VRRRAPSRGHQHLAQLLIETAPTRGFAVFSRNSNGLKDGRQTSAETAKLYSALFKAFLPHLPEIAKKCLRL
jgi:hypothetical protein